MVSFCFVENGEEHCKSRWKSQRQRWLSWFHILGYLVYYVVWSSLEGSALAYPSLCLPKLGISGFDSLLNQFQVLSQEGKWLSVHQSKNNPFCWNQICVMIYKRELRCPLTADWINLPWSTVMSLSFCNRIMNGDSWTRCFGENEWIDCVHTCLSLAWQSCSTDIDVLTWLN